MKTFIVFLSMVLVLVSFLAFTSDMDTYVKLQNHLKALAEECACGTALFTDEAEFAEGRMVIDPVSADRYINFLISEAQSMPPLAKGTISAGSAYYDDTSVVTLTYTGPDIFRLPFFSVTEVTRTAVYKWEE